MNQECVFGQVAFQSPIRPSFSVDDRLLCSMCHTMKLAAVHFGGKMVYTHSDSTCSAVSTSKADRFHVPTLRQQIHREGLVI